MIELISSVSCESNFDEIGRKIMDGCTVVFPTDTIYGLGTSPMSDSGIRKCFNIKKREMEKKLPVLFSSASEASKMVIFDNRARVISDRFWPGQITMVLPVRDLSFPPELCGEDRTLAVRVPRHECCLRLISACGHSLIGTSANVTSHTPFIDPNDPKLAEFASAADYFVRGVCGKNRLPSTVLDLSKKDRVVVLREGAIPVHEILDYLANDRSIDLSPRATST